MYAAGTMRFRIVVSSVVLVVVMSAPVFAQSTPEAARAATDAAKSVNAKAETQSVVLTRPLTRAPIITAPSGRECVGGFAAASDVASTHINPAGALAPNSSTLVQLPIQAVRSDYLFDVRAATHRASVAEACARPSR
jgi:hypothetical protein